MSKVKGRKAPPEPEVYGSDTSISSVIFGLVMVVAMIVAGAALLGGSLSKAGQRWGSAMDGISRSVGLSVGTVEVIGLEHQPSTAREIKIAAMIEPGENMFRADPHVIRRRVEDTRLVSNVRVYRLWPDTVMIYADAAEPSALWHNGEDWAVVDNLGRLMTRAKPADNPSLVKSVGEGAPEAVPALNTAFADMPELTAYIDHAKRVAGRRWDLVLNTGTIVKLPSDEDLKDGIAMFARLEKAGELTRRPLQAIDLRVPGRVFLTPYGSSRVEEAA